MNHGYQLADPGQRSHQVAHEFVPHGVEPIQVLTTCLLATCNPFIADKLPGGSVVRKAPFRLEGTPIRSAAVFGGRQETIEFPDSFGLQRPCRPEFGQTFGCTFERPFRPPIQTGQRRLQFPLDLTDRPGDRIALRGCFSVSCGRRLVDVVGRIALRRILRQEPRQEDGPEGDLGKQPKGYVPASGTLRSQQRRGGHGNPKYGIEQQ